MSKEYLEYGRVLDDSGDRFLLATPSKYEMAQKSLSGEVVHIIRIPQTKLHWLAVEILLSMSADDADQVAQSAEWERQFRESEDDKGD